MSINMRGDWGQGSNNQTITSRNPNATKWLAFRKG